MNQQTNQQLIPTKLEEWNYDIIKKLSENYVEADTFDFKYTIKTLDQKEHTNIIQTCCAFANTKGGFMVFGVFRRDDRNYEIRGLDRSDNLARDFGDKIRSIDPTVYFIPSTFLQIPKSEKILFVVHIPQSPNRPHMIENGSLYYRTNKGNEIMKYSQVKEEFLKYEERRHKLRLLYTELLTNRLIGESLITEEKDLGKAVPLTEFEVDVIINLLPDIHPIIQDNPDLLRALLDLRISMAQTNSRTKLIRSYAIAGNYQTAMATLGAEINQMVNKKIFPKIEEIKSILETKYNVKNPFQD